MSKISQRQAVEESTQTYFGDKFEAGTDVKSFATKEDQKCIAKAVAEGMLEGQVELSEQAFEKYASKGIEHLTSAYVMGMVKNWFNKSTTLNGGVKYEAKNPGSRKGISNPEVKTLRNLLKQHEGDVDATTRIQAELDSKLAEIEAAKPAKQAKSIVIDESLVPDSLKEFAERLNKA